MKTMFATVGLAEWIIDDTTPCLVYSIFSVISGAGRQMALVTLHNQSVIFKETKYKFQNGFHNLT